MNIPYTCDLLLLPKNQLEEVYNEKIFEVKDAFKNIQTLEKLSFTLYQTTKKDKQDSKRYMTALLDKIKKISAKEEAFKHILSEIDKLKKELEKDANILLDEITQIKEYHNESTFNFEDPSRWFIDTFESVIMGTSENITTNQNSNTNNSKFGEISSDKKRKFESSSDTIVDINTQPVYITHDSNEHKTHLKSWTTLWKK
jgi:predicted nuclease with TOPRIM domain